MYGINILNIILFVHIDGNVSEALEKLVSGTITDGELLFKQIDG